MPKNKAQKPKTINTVLSVLKYIMIVFLSLVLGLNIYMFNAKKISREMLPMPFGYGVATVMSGSMLPTLNIGDLVIVKKIDDNNKPQKSDVVVYQDNDILVIHRLVAINDELGFFITKGDANDAPDAPIRKEAARATLIKRIPYIGNIILILKNPIVIIILIAIVIALTELTIKKSSNDEDDDIDKIKKEIEKLKKENILDENEQV